MSTDQQSPNLSLSSFADLYTLKLLLVEDIEINQLFALDMLNEIGLKADTASNGEEAIEKILSNHYDAILMDIEMPVMDGIEACKRIRALGGAFATLPIVAVSAHTEASDIERSLSAGMNYHLKKPFDANEVSQTLFKIAAMHRRHG